MKKTERSRPALLAVSLGGSILAVILALLLVNVIRGGRQASGSGGEDTPYPYRWAEKRDGTLSVTLSAPPEGYAWSADFGADAETVAAEQTKPGAFILAPLRENPATVTFTLAHEDDAADRLAALELGVSVETRGNRLKIIAALDELTVLPGMLRGGDELGCPYRIWNEGPRLIVFLTDGAEDPDWAVHIADRRVAAASWQETADGGWRAAFLAGETGETALTLLSDPKVQQSMQPEPESVPKAEVRRRTNRYAPLYEGAQAQECADALKTVLHKLGVPEDTLSGIANKAVSNIKLSGSAEFQRMARAALYAYQEQRTAGTIAKDKVDELQAASIFYCDQKPKVRATQSGRDRYQAALQLLTLVSAPDDKKLLGCFDRINAARKVKPGDADFVSPEGFYTEAALTEAKKRQQKQAYRRTSAVTTAEVFMSDKLTTMGERFIGKESRYTVGHVKEDMPRYRDVTRSECVNALGNIWMDAVVKQQEEKQKRGADESPEAEEIKQHAIAYRALLAATLAETIYQPKETVRTAYLDNLMQSVIKRYDLDRKLDEINFDDPNEIMATKNAFKEVAVAFCKENGIEMAESQMPEQKRTGGTGAW